MKDSHPHIDPEDFVREMPSYGTRQGQAALAQHLHLVEGCPECTRRLLCYFELGSLAEIARYTDPHGELLRRIVQNKAAAPVAWLESLPQKERLSAVRRDKKLRTQVVVEGLLLRVRDLRAAEPEEARSLTELAVAILPHLVEQDGDPQEACDLAARVWAHHGNVLRILSDLNEADRAFCCAGEILETQPCEDLVLAEVRALEASLRRAQRRYEEALRAVDRAIQIYGEWDEWHLQGQELLTRARILSEMDRPEAALADLHRALPMLEPEAEPRFALIVTCHELHLLCETARFVDAEASLSRARELASEHGSPVDRLRVRWCEGRIAAALGPAAEAETAFREVRRGFIGLGNGYDAALVSLDLAVLYAGQGRAAEIRELAQEMVTIFQSRGVGTEAMAAGYLFCQATLQESVTAEALAEVRTWLKANRQSQ